MSHPIPDEAMTRAAEAMEAAAIEHLGRDLGTIHRDDIARAALAAAVPLCIAAYLDALVEDEAEPVGDANNSGEWIWDAVYVTTICAHAARLRSSVAAQTDKET